jgi:hypothetical protein
MVLIEKRQTQPAPVELDELTFDFLDDYTGRTPTPEPAHAKVMTTAMDSFRRVHKLAQ